ncbi:hypothetical protein SBA1_530030 [Candidatus Sulfotelmatobacter kueseliae]|uniref:Uncharacterized protein n=1 Tax=Candidatus Sulfotelmatobacter kueseliae TaxID=2042962 RepID=A0A2U3KXK9_9BACT|nr:hypothetical protein SBA1_530030 [Candidatus Sulfotelmatobacter kueseliae]
MIRSPASSGLEAGQPVIPLPFAKPKEQPARVSVLTPRPGFLFGRGFQGFKVSKFQGSKVARLNLPFLAKTVTAGCDSNHSVFPPPKLP